MTKRQGKLIVIDGIDGTNKYRLIGLLKNWLSTAGYRVEIADPLLNHARSTGLVEEYLTGKHDFGDQATPRQSSIFHAIDRFDASFKIKKWLRDDCIVLISRYATSNMARQGAKIYDLQERHDFYNWVQHLEYEIFDLPKPNAVIILQLSADLVLERLKNNIRDIIFKKTFSDINQLALGNLRQVELAYQEIARLLPNTITLSCELNGQALPIEAVYQKLQQQISDILLIHPAKILETEFPPTKMYKFEKPAKVNMDNKLTIKKITPVSRLPDRDNSRVYRLYSSGNYTVVPFTSEKIHTGIKVFVPHHQAGLIYSSTTGQLFQILHSGEEKTIILDLYNNTNETIRISLRQKIANLVVLPVADAELFTQE